MSHLISVLAVCDVPQEQEAVPSTAGRGEFRYEKLGACTWRLARAHAVSAQGSRSRDRGQPHGWVQVPRQAKRCPGKERRARRALSVVSETRAAGAQESNRRTGGQPLPRGVDVAARSDGGAYPEQPRKSPRLPELGEVKSQAFGGQFIDHIRGWVEQQNSCKLVLNDNGTRLVNGRAFFSQ